MRISAHFAKTIKRMENMGMYFDFIESYKGWYRFFTGIGSVSFETQREIETWMKNV